MAIRPEDEYTNTEPASASYPGGSFKNETAPGNLDGTPFEKKWPDDIQGILQKLLDAAGITASGTPDTVVASDYYDALVKIFGFAHVYDDTGAANAYQLALRSGAKVEDYQDGQPITFMATSTNTGASTAQIDALGTKDITYPDGSPLLGNEILDGSFISLIFNETDDRLELWVWVPGAYSSTMTGDETFIYPFQKERVSTLDGGVLNRNYNPTGTFPNGNKETVINVGSTNSIIFDSGDLAEIISPGNNVSFIFNTASGSWEVLEQPSTGISTLVLSNNSNGNPNFSDTTFDVEGVTLSTWESIGPTASGADHIWTALDTVPTDVDWIKIRLVFDVSESAGTPNNSIDAIVYIRKTGSAQATGTDNRVLSAGTLVNANGRAKVQQVSEITISTDSAVRFDLWWVSSYPLGSSTAFIVLVGYGYNA